MRTIIFVIFIIMFVGSGSLALASSEKKTDIVAQSKAEPSYTKEFMFSSGGQADRLKLSGSEKWYGIYIDKGKILISSTKLTRGDVGSVSTEPMIDNDYIYAEASFFGISELINGPQTGKAAKFISAKCERKERTTKAIQAPDRSMMPAGTEFCGEETQKFSFGEKEIKIEKTYVESPGFNVYAMKMIWGGQSVILIQERRPTVLMLGDLGEDGSLEAIFTYYDYEGYGRIRLVKVENGKVRTLYDGADTGPY